MINLLARQVKISSWNWILNKTKESSIFHKDNNNTITEAYSNKINDQHLSIL